MKKRSAIIAAMALSVMCLTAGCGLVKVVPIGEEASYTGKQTFDSSEESSNDWTSVVEDVTSKAVPLEELLKGDGIAAEGSAVSATGKVVEFNTDTPKNYLLVTVDGVKEEIRIQAGKVYSGTTLRDVQSIKAFQNFTNQTEWSQYAKALNKEVHAQIVAPLALDDSAAGKTVTFVGAASKSGDTITVTPVSLTLE